jgi:hypothetical protein
VLLLLHHFDVISFDTLRIAWLAKYVLLGAVIAIAGIYLVVGRGTGAVDCPLAIRRVPLIAQPADDA